MPPAQQVLPVPDRLEQPEPLVLLVPQVQPGLLLWDLPGQLELLELLDWAEQLDQPAQDQLVLLEFQG